MFHSKNNMKTMGRKVLQLIVLAIIATHTCSLAASSEEDETSTKTIKYAVRGAAAQITKSSYLNEAIDSFFDSDEDPTVATNIKDEINLLANTEALKSFLIAVRRQLHRHPEVMYQESFTSQTIQTILTELDIKYTTGWAKKFTPGCL